MISVELVNLSIQLLHAVGSLQGMNNFADLVERQLQEFIILGEIPLINVQLPFEFFVAVGLTAITWPFVRHINFELGLERRVRAAVKLDRWARVLHRTTATPQSETELA